MTGEPVDLLSYEDVARQLRITGRFRQGVRQIPLTSIVGSVGRYTDFTRSFLPQKKSDLERWTRVRTAAADMSQLPPIEVYQIGEAYFVLDGNHRVSIARQEGLSYIDAEVTEVRTRVPFAADDKPDELILKAEYAAFLEFTGLDRLRPGADLVVSIPGQYAHLENHIEVHRYLIETAEERELSYEEAVCCWYDDAYLPMVEAIREQGILRYFPGRTETDFYLWLAAHRAELQQEFGWKVKPEAAVGKLASQVRQDQQRYKASIGQRVLNAVIPDRQREGFSGDWSKGRLLARYSDRLFADLLVPLSSDSTSWRALDQALVIAEREGSQLHGLILSADDPLQDGQPSLSVEETFKRRLKEASIEGDLAATSTSPADAICRRVLLADLLVTDPILFRSDNDTDVPVNLLLSLLKRLARPVMVVTGPILPLQQVLLAYDGRAKSREALFVAAYLAERWRTGLTLVTVHENGQEKDRMLAQARAYLELHELKATFVLERGPVAEALLRVANARDLDLIIVGGREEHLFTGRGDGKVLPHLLAQCDRPLLVCS